MAFETRLVTDAGVHLQPGAIHLWAVALDQPASRCDRMRARLSADERERADRFVFDRDRRAFIVGRCALRSLIARYLHLTPESLLFAYGERGKPSVQGQSNVFFNLSHAGGIGVVAVAPTEVGVDVEALDRQVDFESLAQRFFSAQEARELMELPASSRRLGFFNCWTRKEAYIKAIGDGLACPLDSFGVTLRPGEPPRMRWIADDSAEAWQLRGFVPAPGFVGAVAVRAPIRSLSLEWWTDAGGDSPRSKLSIGDLRS